MIEGGGGGGSWFSEALSSILLFALVFGMSATVQFQQLRKQIRNHTALLLGVCMQFLILPFCGFIIVNALSLPAPMGITLLVITSSPGGSYSNWWCSMFNAELSLSVCMTALSTLLSTIMLPTNLVLYTQWTYSAEVVQSLDWHALMVSLVVVISAISLGLLSSAYYSIWVEGRGDREGFLQAMQFRKKANQMGNLAGLSLIVVSATVSSSNQSASLWDQDLTFYIGVALPAVIGLTVATYLGSKAQLEKPERVAVAVESCYQNTGIATSVALTMFANQGEDLATAVGVPLYYGLVEAGLLAVFCLVCWKRGWTKAPPDENLCVALAKSYEIEPVNMMCDENVAIEVVLGSDSQRGEEDPSQEGPRDDLIFAQTEQGAYVVDEGTLSKMTQSNTKAAAEENTEITTADEDDDHVVEIPLDGNDNKAATTRGTAAEEGSAGSSTAASSSSSASSKTPTTTRTEAVAAAAASAASQASVTMSRWGSRTLATLRARSNGYRSGQRPPPPQHPTPLHQDEHVVGNVDHNNTTSSALLTRRHQRVPVVVVSEDSSSNGEDFAAAASPNTTTTASRDEENGAVGGDSEVPTTPGTTTDERIDANITTERRSLD